MRITRTLAALALAAPLTTAASAQQYNRFPTRDPGQFVPGAVQMCVDANGYAVPVSGGTCAPLPVLVTNPSSGGGSGGTTNVTTSSSQWWTEASAQSVGTSGFNGASRSSGATAGQSAPYAYFQAQVTSTVGGTLQLVNETTPGLTLSMAVQPNAVASLKGQAFGASFHATFTPTGAATVSLADGYTSN